VSHELDDELGFSPEEVSACLDRHGLLSLEVEFTRKCDLRCVYCYASAGEALPNELSLAEILDTIEQAKRLGAKRIILLGGGEPLLYPALKEVIEYIHALGLSQAVFTNGMRLTPELCRVLYDHRVTVSIKQNSFLPAVQNALVGTADAYDRMERGLRLLMRAGYPDKQHPLCVQTVICRPNLGEIASMWIWAREAGVTPYFEILTDQGRVRDHPEIALSPEENQIVFEQLASIDRLRFGVEWIPRPPIAGFSCRRHLYSCLVTSQGSVQPCPGVDVPVGNIREEPLAVILRESSVIRELRQVYEHIDPQCRACLYAGTCYGCRGNAYQATGNYLAIDPGCWVKRPMSKPSSRRIYGET
jgi:radical SAM protein with 4Fe4S-binding SPASM domain